MKIIFILANLYVIFLHIYALKSSIKLKQNDSVNKLLLFCLGLAVSNLIYNLFK